MPSKRVLPHDVQLAQVKKSKMFAKFQPDPGRSKFNPNWTQHKGPHVIQFEKDINSRRKKRNERRKTLFLKAHELAVLSGGSIFVTYKDDNEQTWSYASTEDLWQQYCTTGLKQVSGEKRCNKDSQVININSDGKRNSDATVNKNVTIPTPTKSSPFNLSYADVDGLQSIAVQQSTSTSSDIPLHSIEVDGSLLDLNFLADLGVAPLNLRCSTPTRDNVVGTINLACQSPTTGPIEGTLPSLGIQSQNGTQIQQQINVQLATEPTEEATNPSVVGGKELPGVSQSTYNVDHTVSGEIGVQSPLNSPHTANNLTQRVCLLNAEGTQPAFPSPLPVSEVFTPASEPIQSDFGTSQHVESAVQSGSSRCSPTSVLNHPCVNANQHAAASDISQITYDSAQQADNGIDTELITVEKEPLTTSVSENSPGRKSASRTLKSLSGKENKSGPSRGKKVSVSKFYSSQPKTTRPRQETSVPRGVRKSKRSATHSASMRHILQTLKKKRKK